MKRAVVVIYGKENTEEFNLIFFISFGFLSDIPYLCIVNSYILYNNRMKSLVLVPLFLVSILHCLAQSSGGDFTKRIEFNVINCLYEKSADGDSMKLTYKYNLSGKSVNEKFLFGDMTV